MSGKNFEKNFEDSCRESNIFTFRVRDVNPYALKNSFAVPKNPYDTILFDGKHLFTIELKTTQKKSITHRGSNPQIKEHQIEGLRKAAEFDNVIAGLVVNFRGEENKTYFLHIDDFLTYDAVSKDEIENPYESKKNDMSIPLRIFEEIGLEILNTKKRVHHRYFINDFLDHAINDYHKRDST